MMAVAEAPAAANGIAPLLGTARKLGLFLSGVEKGVATPHNRIALAAASECREDSKGCVPRGRARSGEADALLNVVPTPAFDAVEARVNHGVLRIVREQRDGVQDAVDW